MAKGTGHKTPMIWDNPNAPISAIDEMYLETISSKRHHKELFNDESFTLLRYLETA